MSTPEATQTSSADPSTPTADTGGDSGSSDAPDTCASGSTYNGSLGLRVGAIFIILATSLFGTLFPIMARRVKSLNVPIFVFDFAKYFGSGVIIATAFIHLLSPGFEELLYPWPAAIAMTSVFGIFLIEFFALRIGMARLEALGLEIDPHIAEHHTAHEHRPRNGEPRAPLTEAEEHARAREEAIEDIETGALKDTTTTYLAEKGQVRSDLDTVEATQAVQNPAAQIMGVAILEFGVIFHSVIIGLTLAVTDDFNVLFIVIIFHQMFEGLGLGSRLAYLPLPLRLNYVPIIAGITYACITPLGLAIGLGVRTTYNDDSQTANIVQGVLDSTSAGILLYTGLVELLAHEFLFHPSMRKAPIWKVLYALGSMITGAGIMALLGRWA